MFAARETDSHVCPSHGGGVIKVLQFTVYTAGLLQARQGDLCPCPIPGNIITKGSTGVKVVGSPAARVLDTTSHGFISGFTPKVMIGEMGGGGGGGGAVGLGGGMTASASAATGFGMGASSRAVSLADFPMPERPNRRQSDALALVGQELQPEPEVSSASGAVLGAELTVAVNDEGEVSADPGDRFEPVASGPGFAANLRAPETKKNSANFEGGRDYWASPGTDTPTADIVVDQPTVEGRERVEFGKSPRIAWGAPPTAEPVDAFEASYF